MALPAFKSNLHKTSGTGNATLAWLATAVDANDMILIFCESFGGEQVTTPTGYQLACEPVAAGGGNTILTVFWRRATGDETGATVIDPGDHIVAVAHAYTGVHTEGDPFHHVVTEFDGASTTSVSIDGGTTSINDCLIVGVCATGSDITSTTEFGSLTNADLSSLTERSDDWVVAGNGGGLATFDGGKATAGSYGATTATLGNANPKATAHFALKPTDAASPSEPWVSFFLSANAGIGTFSHTWSASEVEANDIIVILIETADQAIAAPTGYAAVADSPQANTGTTRLTAYWKLSDGTETGASIGDSGDHQISVAFAIRNCHTASGNPWDVTAGGSEGSDTSLSATGDTTTVANCLVLVAATGDIDQGNNAIYNTWANSDLTRVQPRIQVASAQGNGGSIDVFTGVKASAGAFGATTATARAATTKAFLTIAFKPPQVATDFVPRVVMM